MWTILWRRRGRQRIHRLGFDPEDDGYGNLSEEEKARYSEFGDAWIKKLVGEGPPALLPVPVPLPGPVPVALAPQPDKVI